MSLEAFLLAFIPLFVAIDIIGTSPIFLGFTEGLSDKERKKLTYEALATALGVAMVFLIGGNAILKFLGITINDLRIAGGIILLALSINDILSSSEKRRNPGTNIGVVPLGIPLIMGPAALATIMILLNKHGFQITILSLITNFIIIAVVLVNAKFITKLIGEGGAKAFAKVASLLLSAYAVMMIREGIEIAIQNLNR
ncbi:MAG: MarC family protein [Melioribacteraceae bacterium]|nr:MarC family protein [Melioribacteraceae bacterium]